MTSRGSTFSVPIWLKAPGIIVLFLVAVVLAAMLLGVAADRGGIGGGGTEHNGGQTGDHGPPGGQNH